MENFLLFLITLFMFNKYNLCQMQVKQIPVGGIFHYNNENEIIFRQQLFTRSNMYNSRYTFLPVVHHVQSTESFKSGKIACNLSAEGVVAIIGPQSADCNGIVDAVCHNIKLPHLQTHWDPTPAPPDLASMALRLYPDAEILAQAYADILKSMEWKSFTIIYEKDDAFIRLQKILQAHTSFEKLITVRQLGPGPDFRTLLKEVKASGETHIILDCDTKNIYEVLKQALEIDMLGEYMNYFLTSLDAHTINYGPIQDDLSNMTTVRLINPKNSYVQRVVRDLNDKIEYLTPDTLTTEMALIHDAVNVVYEGVRFAEQNQSINIKRLMCTNPMDSSINSKWEDGERIYKFLKDVRIDGLTGPIQFDEYGNRKQFRLEHVELISNGFHQVSTWDWEQGISMNKTYNSTLRQYEQALRNKTFRVVSRIGGPYLLWKDRNATGNERFHGFVMDLIDAIAKMRGFKYEFKLVRDDKYGNLNKKTKKWDGLIKDILDRQADLAVCDLTITYDRRTAVDFTMPFMTLGISILYRKPVQQAPALFSFMKPLSFGVWMYTVTAFLGVSFFLYGIARMCPKDWENPHPCNQKPDELENIWCLKNCIWLSLGSFMCQGCDILPKGSSTRIATACWWFFALIITQSYCANLTAFLTMERMDATISSAEELAKQTKIKYGTVDGGSTYNFFKESNHSVYHKMWSAMESARPSVFVKKNDEGVERVLNGKGQYAFLMESTSIEYVTERICELTQIGGKLDTKGYGIAMPVNSPYRTWISEAVLKLQEDGKINQLKTKWWREMEGGGACTVQEEEVANEMGFENVAGVFVLLGLGCGIALLVAILEFLWNVRKVAVDNKLTYWEACVAELKFAIKIYIKTKPVKTERSETTSSSGRGDSNSTDGDTHSMAASMLRSASSFLRLDQMLDRKNQI